MEENSTPQPDAVPQPEMPNLPPDPTPSAWPAERLVIFGSEEFTIAEAIPRAVLNWWVARNRPDNVQLVLDDSHIGRLAYTTLAVDKFPHDVFQLDPGAAYPERDLWARMLRERPAHAFVFAVAGDASIEPRMMTLAVLGVPTTIVTESEMNMRWNAPTLPGE